MASVVTFFSQFPVLFVVTVGLLGLIVGSFLNVVIARLPVILEKRWRRECLDFLGQAGEEPEERFDLAWPPSHCPHCRHQIGPWENIPVLSWFMLRGHCRHCGQKISLRYPVVETVTAALSLAVAWRFGVTIETLWALVLTWNLVALTLIDIDHQLLPDAITLPLLWLGLLLSLFDVFTDSASAIVGAASGYMILWSVFHLFRLVTGKEGMGYGDFKLLALFGAWFGWQKLPLVILLSSLVGALLGLFMILFRGRDRNIPIPFGPYLAVAGWLAMMWGDEINAWYLHLSGLN